MVLVILAILAAILVPALLGWIDNAKEKQYVLDARNVYLATQAAIDEVYAMDASKISTNADTIDAGTDDLGKIYDKIVSLSDAKFTSISGLKFGGNGDDAAGGADITEMTINGLQPNGLDSKTLILGDDGWTVS